MSFFGSIIPTGPLAPGAGENAVRRKREELRKGDDLDASRRDEDKADISAAEDLHAGEPVRRVRRNDSEESREEHTEHGVYGPSGRRRPDDNRPRLNLEG